MDEQTPPAPTTAAPSPKTSGLAIASALLGAIVWYPSGLALFSFPRAIAAVAAIICGIIAIVQISKSSGSIKGRVVATIGLVLSVGILLLPILFAYGERAEEYCPRCDCADNMKRIGLAIAMYADEHNGEIPREFHDLRPYATDLDKLLICPSAKDTGRPSYEIVLGGSKWNSAGTTDAVVLTESPSNHRIGHNNLYGDGHVAWVLNEPNHQ